MKRTLQRVLGVFGYQLARNNQVVTTPFQDRFEFAMDPFRKQCLISGQDEIGLTLGMANVITAHEARLAAERPWIAGAAHRVS
jgi:3-isopropylmalate dehydratase small subunit